MAVDLQPYKIGTGDKNYPEKHDDSLDHMESEINSGLSQITANLDTLSGQIASEINTATGALSLQITGELDAAVEVVEGYRDQSAVSANTATTQAGIATDQAQESAAERVLSQAAKDASSVNADRAVNAVAVATDPNAMIAELSTLYEGLDIRGIAVDMGEDSNGWQRRVDPSYTREPRPSGSYLGKYEGVAAAVADGGAAEDWYWNTANTSFYKITDASAPAQDRIYRAGSAHMPVSRAAVAVGTSDTARLLILDLGKPGAPMWMEFNNDPVASTFRNGLQTMLSGRYFPSRLEFNGSRLILGLPGTNDYRRANGIHIIDFARDMRVGIHATGASYSSYDIWRGNIAGRNSLRGSKFISNEYSIPANSIDSMTTHITEDAPLDAITGMPLAYITGSTPDGQFVIKPDGTTVSSSDGAAWDHTVVLGGDLYASQVLGKDDIGQFGKISLLGNNFAYESVFSDTTIPKLSSETLSGIYKHSPNTLAAVYNGGVDIVLVNPESVTGSLIAKVGANFNTGWYQDSDGTSVILCGTETGSIDGTEDFYTTSNALNGDALSLSSIGSSSCAISGEGTVTNGNTAALKIEPSASVGRAWVDLATAISNAGLSAGDAATVRLSARASSAEGALRMFIGTTNGGGVISELLDVPADDTYADYGMTFTVSSGDNFLVMQENNASNDGVGYFTGLALGRAATDYSGNGLPFTVNGSLDRNAVNGGFSAWSEFGATDYLSRPYDANLNVGTGDFYIRCVIQTSVNNTNQTVCNRVDSGGSDGRILLLVEENEQLSLYLGSSRVLTGGSVTNGAYTTASIYRLNGTVNMKIDGTIVDSAADSTDISTTDSLLEVGARASNPGLEAPFGGSLAMFSIHPGSTSHDADDLWHRDTRALLETGTVSLSSNIMSAAYNKRLGRFDIICADGKQRSIRGLTVSTGSDVSGNIGSARAFVASSGRALVIGGDDGLAIGIESKNLREHESRPVKERFKIRYAGDATGSRSAFPDPSNQAEVDVVRGAKPVGVSNAGDIQTEGDASDYVVKYNGFTYWVDFAVDPADGNDVIVEFEKEVYQ